jgi:hypothetical protein
MNIDNFKDKGLSGLANLGNTCFVNSCMQVISHTYELNNFLDKETYKGKLRKKYESALIVEWDNLRKILWNENCVVSPNKFIKTISFRQNKLTNFDFNYTQGATSIDLFVNELTGTTNLSGHTSLVTLNISNNNFINSPQIIQGNFPSTLRTFTSQGSQTLTGWTSTFSAMTNMLSLDFRNTNLKTAAVDYILDDVATIAVANNLYNKTLNLSGTPPNQPESPTGGVTNADYILLTSSPYNWTVTITP